MKSARPVILALLLLLSVVSLAVAQAPATLAERLFFELWSDNSYRSTNFGADEPAYREDDFFQPAYREEDYLLSQLSLQAGLRTAVADSLFFDMRLSFELTGDWANEEWNDAYWNNMVAWGPGARLSYETSAEEDENRALWVSDFNAEFFADLLFSDDSPDQGKERIPALDARDNFRTGLSVWSAIDSREMFSGAMSLWAEIWAEAAYETTAFAEEPAEDFYPLNLDILAGPQFPVGRIAVQPYAAITVSCDLGDEAWNKEPWLNNVTWGPGFRLSMGDLVPIAEADLYLYAEYLEVDYFSRVDEESYAYSADEDFRAGIELYLPFGATRDRIKRH
ncbi:MAG TPA: hypothetical protein DDY20_08500 [Desulfobulbaceae bacterium]|jgi:hypothetical protein|nr:hypothetical protein [Desulfobulbaceae bacterium]